MNFGLVYDRIKKKYMILGDVILGSGQLGVRAGLG